MTVTASSLARAAQRAPGTADAAQAFALATLRARILTIGRQRRTALLWSLLLMGYMVAALWGTQPAPQLLAWWGSNALFAILRLASWRRAPPERAMDWHAARRWMRESTLANGLNGLIWGAGAWAFLDYGDTGLFIVFLLVLTSLTCGAALSLAAWFPSVVAFCVPTTLLAAARVYTLDFDQADLITASCFVYLAFVLGVARNYEKIVMAAITADLRNAHLLEQAAQQRDMLERVTAERASFFAAVSHDLRQPLYAMGLLLDGLRRRLSSDEQRQLHADIHRSHVALDELVSALLDISQVDAAGANVRITDFALDDLLDTLVAEFAPAAAARGIGLRFTPSTLWVRSDRLLLLRILRNLIGNAVKFTAAGQVALGATAAGDTVALTVQDTGCGIAPQDQERVFGEYVQLDTGARAGARGLGLGLAVVRRLCDLLGIELALDSAPGRGSRFTLRLARGEAAIADDADAPAAPFVHSGLHVVVIDDEADVRRAMGLLLSDYQCTVTCGDCAATVLTALSDTVRPVDVVISDYRLRDGSDGIAAVAAVRAALDPDLPALLITGDTDPGVGHAAAAAGLPLLYKPVAPRALLEAVAALV